MTVDLVIFYYFLIGYFLIGVSLTLLALLVCRQIGRGLRTLGRHHLRKDTFRPEPSRIRLASAGSA